MYRSGLAFVLAGLLAETPQSLISMGIVGVLNPVTLPGSELTRSLACIGFVLCVCGLHRMLRAKGRQGWLGLVGILGVPGALAGLAIVALMRRSIAPPLA